MPMSDARYPQGLPWAMDALFTVQSAFTTYMVCREESAWWFVQPEPVEPESEMMERLSA